MIKVSKISIKYSSISAAKSEAKSVARKLDNYYDSLNSSVYKKLSNYSGPSSSNITDAKRSIGRKLNALNSAKNAYTNYANSLSDLTESCKQVDKRVKASIERLASQFKARNGIKNSWIENTFSGIISFFENKTPLGRWFSTARDLASSVLGRLKDKIKAWYMFDGGKDFVKGVLIGVLEVVIGVCSLIAAIASGGALIVVLAGVIGAAIAIGNGVLNIINEGRAVFTAGNDPALAKRLHGENSFQDMVRCEALKNVKNWYTASKTVTAVSFACTAITLISDIGKLLDKGLRWATGSSELSMKDYFSTKNYKSLFKKTFDAVKTGFKDFGQSLSGAGGITLTSVIQGLSSDVGKALKVFKGDFFQHFRDVFAKGTAPTIKEFAGIAKSIIAAESMGDLIFAGFEKLVVPSIVLDHNAILGIEKSGQVKWEYDWLKFKDLYSIPTDFSKKIVGSDLFKPSFKNGISNNAYDKLSSASKIDIKIPTIDIPQFSFKEVVSFRSFSPIPAH